VAVTDPPLDPALDAALEPEVVPVSGEDPGTTPGRVAGRRHPAMQAQVRRVLRSIVVCLVLFGVGFFVFCLTISIGKVEVPVPDVALSLLGFGDERSDFVVRTLRLPRTLAAAEVGVAFGMSGALFQAFARNPLASPDVIGITNGASAAAVFAIVVLAGTSLQISMGALAGALITAIAVYLLAYRRGVSSYRLVLVGIGLGAVLSAATSYLLTRADIYAAQEATVWLTGSLNGVTWAQIRPLTIGLAVLVPLAMLTIIPLRMLLLGDETAKGAGVRVEGTRRMVIFTGVGLVAVGTAAAGPVAFLAFLSAPIARRLVNSPLAVVTSGLVGAVILLTADLLANHVIPNDMPVGIVTGIIGAPYLLVLLAVSNRIGKGG
jgi:iron complex transport system permease protein